MPKSESRKDSRGSIPRRQPWIVREKSQSSSTKTPVPKPTLSDVDTAALLKLSQLAALITGGNSGILTQLAGIGHSNQVENIESGLDGSDDDIEPPPPFFSAKLEPNSYDTDSYIPDSLPPIEDDLYYEKEESEEEKDYDNTPVQNSVETTSIEDKAATSVRESGVEAHNKAVRESLGAIVQAVQGINKSLQSMEDMFRRSSGAVGLGAEKIKDMKVLLPGLPAPADTIEELQKWLSIAEMEAVAKHIDALDLRKTVRRYVQCMMTKNLALKFSWSGMGFKRMKTKISFQNHKAYIFLKDVLTFTKFKTVSRLEIAEAVKPALAGVSDWYAGRSKRSVPERPPALYFDHEIS